MATTILLDSLSESNPMKNFQCLKSGGAAQRSNCLSFNHFSNLSLIKREETETAGLGPRNELLYPFISKAYASSETHSDQGPAMHNLFSTTQGT
jgi:hypothetical protein